MQIKKLIPVLLAVSLVSSSMPNVFAEDRNATRGEVAQALLTAADDYNPTVKKSDIIQGYDDGALHEEREVTRAEALVMLRRAFGNLPKPTGHNARVALTADDFTDIPDWAQSELENVFDSGIIAGTEEGIFSPDEPVTSDQMKLLIDRVYALFGTNEKDDFYAAVNKEALNKLSIKPGRVMAGTLYDLDDESTEQVQKIIADILAAPQEKGSKEQKIADFYTSILDMYAGKQSGIAPIKKYLDLVETAENTGDLIKIQSVLSDELCVSPFMSFGVTVDLKDSSRHMLYFGTTSPALPKEAYLSPEDPRADAFVDYLKQMFILSGETEKAAETKAGQCYELEKRLAESQMDLEDTVDVDKIYNIFTMQQIRDMIPNADIDAVFQASGLSPADEIGISDVGLTEAFGKDCFTDANLDALKAYAEYAILSSWGGSLTYEFVDAANQFAEKLLGTSGSYTDEEIASMKVTNAMSDYIGELYAEKYFSEEAKKDVEKMVGDIIKVYRSRIERISWMSDATKAEALKKLDTMGVKIGYPDQWETYLDQTEIKSTEDGGSNFSNSLSLVKAERERMIGLQNKPVDKTEWAMYPYTVNACYVPTSNDITFPAAILQAPMYDVNASYEQNLGGIGYVIAHEISHAFDNNGAKYDENGNAADWWTAEDYDAFQKLCDKMAAFYEGQEGVPGIPTNGTLTLSENIADQGAVSCITEIAAGLEQPDFKTLYESVAKCWASTAGREYYQYASQVDFHSIEKLRVNRVVVNCDEFYSAFDIGENDGMYVKPEERVRIW